MASLRQKAMLEAGDRAPDFQLESLTGATETLQSFANGGRLFLAFFKVTCPTCQFTLPFLERMSRSASVPMVAISQDDAESTREFHHEFGIAMPTLLDSEDLGYPASNAFQISHVPSMFLIEPDGRISWVSHGFHKGDLTDLGRRIGVETFHPDDYVPEWKAG